MMIKNYFIFLGALILGIMTSCSSMYIPSTSNIPLFDEKGETQLEVTASTNSACLTADFAFSEKFALMLSSKMSYGNFSDYYDIFTHKDDQPVSDWDLKDYGEFVHKYGEIGIGRYNILEQDLKLEIFGGLGFGNAKDKELGSPAVGEMEYNSDYFLFFLQTNIGKTLGILDFGGALRIASSFFNYSYQVDPSASYPNNNNGEPQMVNFNMIHFEPMGFVRIGNEKIKLVTNLGLSLSQITKSLGDLNLEKGISNGRVNTTGLHISFGVNYNFMIGK